MTVTDLLEVLVRDKCQKVELWRNGRMLTRIVDEYMCVAVVKSFTYLEEYHTYVIHI